MFTPHTWGNGIGLMAEYLSEGGVQAMAAAGVIVAVVLTVAAGRVLVDVTAADYPGPGSGSLDFEVKVGDDGEKIVAGLIRDHLGAPIL